MSILYEILINSRFNECVQLTSFMLDLFDPQFYSCFAGILKQTVTGLDKLCRPYQQEIKTKANKHCGGNGSKSEMIKHAV